MTARFRPLRALTALAATAILAVTACGGSDSGSSTPNAAPTDKVLHLSFLQDPGQPPDPDIYYAGQGLLLTTNTYEGLLQYKAGTDKAELQPLLATEWTASPDNKVFTFKLREGVKFHDGTPFTSAAVKASFDRRVRSADAQPGGSGQERRVRQRADLPDHPRPWHGTVHVDRRRGGLEVRTDRLR
ncbi:ABC transporter substrate-binding protein [Mycobacterium yunnanensis]|uniref:ABC transporter substrate-binding protein n=1 Tax=Mycobacterium yunnanensis TaxID=368477 RepID=UPI0021F2ADA6|nr:ABC transporter substrate-binding protein [Mycobacterium yunnanensis]